MDLAKIAEKIGAKLVDNPKLVEAIKKGLEKKGGHCPCKLPKIPENLCPCRECREDKHCHCGIFVFE